MVLLLQQNNNSTISRLSMYCNGIVTTTKQQQHN